MTITKHNATPGLKSFLRLQNTCSSRCFASTSWSCYKKSNHINKNNSKPNRTGKYIKLQYDHDFRLVGARTEHFLLEKSRLVQLEQSERSYHILYQASVCLLFRAVLCCAVLCVALPCSRWSCVLRCTCFWCRVRLLLQLCAVLCRDALCCAVLCCAVLCLPFSFCSALLCSMFFPVSYTHLTLPTKA